MLWRAPLTIILISQHLHRRSRSPPAGTTVGLFDWCNALEESGLAINVLNLATTDVRVCVCNWYIVWSPGYMWSSVSTTSTMTIHCHWCHHCRWKSASHGELHSRPPPLQPETTTSQVRTGKCNVRFSLYLFMTLQQRISHSCTAGALKVLPAVLHTLSFSTNAHNSCTYAFIRYKHSPESLTSNLILL